MNANESGSTEVLDCSQKPSVKNKKLKAIRASRVDKNRIQYDI